ncbi:Deoxyribodipyrimidine photo-lyase [Nymphaea thermarum]|nr:Deoxyribodipyrimidine photo-lyase [Nymphaea thermarum]
MKGQTYEEDASLLVPDFSPLCDVRKWKDAICQRLADGTAVHEVNTHYVVPVWVESQKLEYSAKTLRSKIHKLLPEYLVEFPSLSKIRKFWKKHPQRISQMWAGMSSCRQGQQLFIEEWSWIGVPATGAATQNGLVGYLIQIKYTDIATQPEISNSTA